MTVMHDYSNECIWLGKHNDLKLTRSCQQLDTVFVRPNTYHGELDAIDAHPCMVAVQCRPTSTIVQSTHACLPPTLSPAHTLVNDGGRC